MWRRSSSTNPIEPISPTAHIHYDPFQTQSNNSSNSSLSSPTNHPHHLPPLNRLTNTRYPPLFFIPLQLYDQFRSFINQYFLFIACLQLIPSIAPVHPLGIWAPLIVVTLVTMIREALDEVYRWKEDQKNNKREMEALVPKMKMTAECLAPGMVITVKKGEFVPCDGIILAVLSDSDNLREQVNVSEKQTFPKEALIWQTEKSDNDSLSNVVHLQTANLDGESDYKQRQALFSKFTCHPQDYLLYQHQTGSSPYTFQGTFYHDSSSETEQTSHESVIKVAVDDHHFCPFGSRIMDKSCLFYCTAVGHLTRLSQSMQTSATRATQLDKLLSQYGKWIFLFQWICVVISSILGTMLTWPSSYLMEWEWLDRLQLPLRFLLLISVMIPISLKVTVDLCKTLFTLIIQKDEDFNDRQSDEIKLDESWHVKVQNSSVIDELGAIQVVVTDKTGTLTENCMIFRALMIMGETEICRESYSSDSFQNWSQFQSNPPLEMKWQIILEMVCLCHAVHLNEQGHFSGTSPDEVALLEKASEWGISLVGERRDALIPKSVDPLARVLVLKCGNQLKYFRILFVFPFDSARRCMAVVVQLLNAIGTKYGIWPSAFMPCSDQNWLLVKGADETVMRQCTNTCHAELMQQCDHLAVLGYRTLVLAAKQFTDKEITAQSHQYETMLSSNANAETLRQWQDAQLNEMTYLATLALEDQLQAETSETIHQLLQAQIKVIVATGDKMSTARHLARQMQLLDDNYCVIEQCTSTAQVQAELFAFLERSPVFDPFDSSSPIELQAERNPRGSTLILDGNSLHFLLESRQGVSLLSRAIQCSQWLICCRVAPLQKRQIVMALKQASWNVLAVGDGGNDVGMIQVASLGVGLLGKEGREAARAADLTCYRFRHLSKLLLFHGRNSYRQLSFIILYCVYKAMLLCALQTSFQWETLFSGASLLDSFSLTTFNLLFTSVPIVMYCFDRDLKWDTLRKGPWLYRLREELDWKRGIAWCLLAWYQSGVIFLVHQRVMQENILQQSGQVLVSDWLGRGCFMSLVLTCTFMLILESHTFHVLQMLILLGSCAFVLPICWLSNLSLTGYLYQFPLFYLTILLSFILAILPFFIYIYVRHADTLAMTALDWIRIQEKLLEQDHLWQGSERALLEGSIQ